MKNLIQIKQLSDMKIATMEAGLKFLIQKLISEGCKIKDLLPINNYRYVIIKGLNFPNILVTYKRDTFHNFSKMFRSQGATGLGETINCLSLKESLINNVEEIYIIYYTGICYTIKLQDFLNKSIKWINKEGIEVRSTSVHNLKRAYDLTEL